MKREIKRYLKQNCPIRLFKRINIVNENGLYLKYRVPTRSGIDISLVTKLDDMFIDYLECNKMDIADICEQRFMIDNVRRLQNEGNTAIKTYCSQLNQEKLLRFNSRIRELQDTINRNCKCKLTDACICNWRELKKNFSF